jgi:hypothetical protein
MTAAELDIPNLLGPLSAQEKGRLLRVLVAELFERHGSSMPIKLIDADGKLTSYVVPAGVNIQLPLLEDSPKEFAAEMKRRQQEPGCCTLQQVEEMLEKEFGPYRGDLPLPISHGEAGATRTK